MVRQPFFGGNRLVYLCVAIAASCGAWLAGFPAAVASPSEYQVKAVFLFNFSQFVDWPDKAFAAPQTPLVIGVLGEDPFGAGLDEVVRGESAGGHPLRVQRFASVKDVGECHILYIARSEQRRLEEILRALKGRSVLTVSDGDNFAVRGGMIRLKTERSRVRLNINLKAAEAAGLTISSKLLRPAEIVQTQTEANGPTNNEHRRNDGGGT